MKIDWLFKFMAFFSVPILVYVNGYMLYFTIRYRNRKGQPIDQVGSSVHDHPALEFWWTAIPSALMLVLGMLSYVLIPQYYTAKAATTRTRRPPVGRSAHTVKPRPATTASPVASRASVLVSAVRPSAAPVAASHANRRVRW